jgi:hypothetical protein
MYLINNSMLRRDERLLMEAYSSIHNNKRDYKPVDKQFIYFPDQDAVYLNPKDSHNAGYHIGDGAWARKELDLDAWEKVKVAVGEDIVSVKEILPMSLDRPPEWLKNIPYIDEEEQWRWYFVPDVFPKEHSFEAYIPYEIDKYKVDRETKDAWREVISDL